MIINTEDIKLDMYIDDVRESFGDAGYTYEEIEEKVNKLSLAEFLHRYLSYNGVQGYTTDILQIVKAFQCRT